MHFAQARTFYYFLMGMFFLHAVFLVVKFQNQITDYSWTEEPEVIKIKFVQETKTHKRQIVQSEDSAVNDKPVDKAFLSDKNRTFDRETVSKNIDTFKKAALGNSAVTQKDQKASKAKKKNPVLKDIKLSDIGLEKGSFTPQEVSRSPASASQKGMKTGDPLAEGLSATNDYVQEVALGDFTHLNTVEFKFYGFYHRIRIKLEQFWGRSIQEKSHALFKSGRRMPAGEDLITSLRITLNQKGEIVKVKIMGTSGYKELDDAAIESFNQAGPFPNPPKDLLVNGEATIEWGFVVKS